MTPYRCSALLVAAALCASPSNAQWNPAVGQWGKTDPADLRVMVWNVQDGVCSTNPKVEGANNWCAIARIIAAMRPDVLVMEECADNSGNGTGGSADSVAQLTTTIGMLLHGGTDTFLGSTPITSWVQKYAAGYDLPYVFVSSSTDGFNRNVLLSRYPFADLNGDGKSTIPTTPNIPNPIQWSPGGDGGIRGFLFAEINLPDATYLGNFVMGGAHLKAGSQASDHTQRITAAENVSYVIRYWFNGNGGTTPDPQNAISDSPAATSVLNALTPVVIGGDWNEDEATNGTKGPAEWLAQAQTAGGNTDGTDRDGSDMTFDSAVNFFSGSNASHNSGSKLDYVAWQDSIATLRLAHIFISGSNPAAAQPPELSGFLPSAASASSTASDHRPVIADLRLPIVDCNGNAIADTTDIANATSQDANTNSIPDECEAMGTPFCFGDGTDPLQLTCPCFNLGASGHGCANSVTALGALLQATGTTNPDTVQLACSLMPTIVSAIYLKGDVNNNAGIYFGDGVRCVDGSLIRLGTENNVSGASHYPIGGQQSVSVRGATPPGSGLTGYYQTYYRNSSATYCPPETFNVSNGVSITW